MPLLMMEMAQLAALGTPVGRCEAQNIECGTGFVNSTCFDLDTLSAPTRPCAHCIVGLGKRYWDPSTQKLDVPPKGSGVYFFGKVEPFTFTTRVISFSVLLQTILFISTGSIADFGPWRYRFLFLSTVLGSILTMAVVFVEDASQYVTLGVLCMLSNAVWGMANVFYNAYIPVLVDTHEDVIQSNNDLEVRDEVQNFISSAGSLCGFSSGLIMTLISLAILVVVPGDLAMKYRLCIFFAGLWWLLWSIWSFLRLKPHAERSRIPKEGEWVSLSGWVGLLHKIREIREYPETFKFLIAWFVYSDTYSTIAAMGILVLQDRLCMGGITVGILLLIVLICAAIGNYASYVLQQWFRMSTKHMIYLCLSNYMLIAVLMTVGIADVPIGLKNIWEAYFFSFVHGFALGPIQAYSRSLMADLTVRSKETEWFALYEITDKGSSWLGPLIVGEMYAATNDFNISFLPLIVMCTISFPLLHWVDHVKGMRECGRQGFPPDAETSLTVSSHSNTCTHEMTLIPPGMPEVSEQKGEEAHVNGGADKES